MVEMITNCLLNRVTHNIVKKVCTLSQVRVLLDKSSNCEEYMYHHSRFSDNFTLLMQTRNVLHDQLQVLVVMRIKTRPIMIRGEVC